MIELGELDRHAADFAARGAKMCAISVDGLEDTKAVQAKFPSILLVSDESQSMSKALGTMHEGAKPGGGDVSAPTTVIVDAQGVVRFLYRPGNVAERIGSQKLLEELDRITGHAH
jgi:peroxiredoxin